MSNEDAIIGQKEVLIGEIEDDIDIDELEKSLEIQMENELRGLEFLRDEEKKIGNPDALGEVIKDVVWEQVINQIAMTAGEDFIKENNGLTLDLSNNAHIQTVKNFEEGNIATHNKYIDNKKKYDDYQSQFQKDENGNIKTYINRAGKEEKVLKKDARKPYDKDRPKGSKEKNIDMDHTISAAEIIRGPAANLYLSEQQRRYFANSPENLKEMYSSYNRSKGDLPMKDWLNTPNSKGQTPKEIFNISDKQEREMLKNDAEARKAYGKKLKEGEKRAIEAGKKSQKEEAFRITGSALRAAIMRLLADLVKEIIAKLVKWFKRGKRNLESLIDSLKEAIHSFIVKMKTHIIKAGNVVISTVLNAIIGPIFATMNKVWMALKQGWKSLKDAIKYIKSPENKGKPIERLLLETGKIIMGGISGISAIFLGEAIEKGLSAIPIFAVNIPLIGSLANILGIFFGAVISGIVGAIAINFIEKRVEKKQKEENNNNQDNKMNVILDIQNKANFISEEKLIREKKNTNKNISERHASAANSIIDALNDIDKNCKSMNDTKSIKSIKSEIDELNELLNR